VAARLGAPAAGRGTVHRPGADIAADIDADADGLIVDRAGSLAGAHVELSVGAPAHGGYCVARLGGAEQGGEDEPGRGGRVVLVRHALPGERVRALITEDRGSFCRADAVEILDASADRVPAPCPHAGPGRCGGCDWQHASAGAQRELKAAVVREQFARLAALDVGALLSGVEPVGDGALLGWRTRIAYAVGRDGRPGLYRHRSHEIEHVTRCPLGVPGVGDAAVLGRAWPGLTGIEAVRGDGPRVSLLAHRPGPGRRQRGRRPPDRVELVDGPARVRHEVLGREFEIAAAGFWQVHPAAAAAFTTALLDALRPEPGERVLDLYAGAGMLTAALADAVGPAGAVLGVESAAQAVADAEGNLAAQPWAGVRQGRVDVPLVADLGAELRPDLVVLDPPRAGAGQDVMRALLELEPRAIGYVACDPAALARDVAVAVGQGWRLRALRAFDAFPMTHHVECVATLTR
jgi:tRNA/tmRNA/rRNA uracil-C5-methylase (TrmA/RlmC/RlmD family)